MKIKAVLALLLALVIIFQPDMFPAFAAAIAQERRDRTPDVDAAARRQPLLHSCINAVLPRSSHEKVSIANISRNFWLLKGKKGSKAIAKLAVS